MPAFRDNRPQAAEQDSDRREVREAAKCKSNNNLRVCRQRIPDLDKTDVSVELVDHQFLPDQATGLDRLVPGHAKQVSHRRKKPSQQPLQCEVLKPEPGADAAHDTIHQVDQADKRDQHGADAQCDLHARHRTVANRFENIYRRVGIFLRNDGPIID